MYLVEEKWKSFYGGRQVQNTWTKQTPKLQTHTEKKQQKNAAVRENNKNLQTAREKKLKPIRAKGKNCK